MLVVVFYAGKTKRGAFPSSVTAAPRLTPCGLVLMGGDVMSRDESREMTWCIVQEARVAIVSNVLGVVKGHNKALMYFKRLFIVCPVIKYVSVLNPLQTCSNRERELRVKDAERYVPCALRYYLKLIHMFPVEVDVLLNPQIIVLG
jgi:hypothetical protein